MKKTGPAVQRHACERCRKAKVRCIVENVGHNSCKRCSGSNAQCVFANIAPRQRRKRTEARLIALEKDFHALRNAYNAAHPNAKVRTDNPQPTSTNISPFLRHNYNGGESSDEDTFPVASTSPLIPVAQSANLDPIPSYVNASDLTYEEAVNLLTVFVSQLLPEHPILSLTECESFDFLRSNKPILLFAVITAASSTKSSNLFEQLHSRLIRTLTEQVVVCGEKSLELLQSIHIAEIWYNPPVDLKRLNFYLWLRLASTLAIQLGLTWDKLAKAVVQSDGEAARVRNSESLQAAFAVFISLSSVSISLQAPSTINFDLDAHTCLALFSALGSQDGQHLYDWVKLQLIAEDIEHLRQKLIHQSSRKILTREAIVKTLSDVSKRLDEIEFTTLKNTNVSFRVYIHYVRCKYHECAVVVADKMTIVRDLFQNCCQMVETFISLSPNIFLTLPTVTTVRVLYSLKVMSALTQMMSKPEAIDSESNRLLFESLLQKTRTHLSNIHDRYGHRTARMALYGLRLTGRADKDTSNSSAKTYGLPGLSRTDDSSSERTYNNDLDIVTSLNMVDVGSISLQNTSVNPLESSSSFQGIDASPWPFQSLSDFELITMPDLDPRYWVYPAQTTDAWKWSDDLVDSSAAMAISAEVIISDT